MPLPPAGPRELFHTRDIRLQGYRRADGLWDIEAHLTDAKTYVLENSWRGPIAPGAPLHDMWIRLTLDHDLIIQAVQAVTDAAPFAICPAIAGNFQRIVGLQIAPGWTRILRQRLGGTEGCTHLVELLAPLATAAVQTISSAKNRPPPPGSLEKTNDARDSPSFPRPILNSCHALATNGPVVAQLYPEFYTGDPTCDP